MEKFLEKFQLEIEKKMLACVKGESIVKPFAQIYNEVREKVMGQHATVEKSTQVKTAIYSDGEASIYAAAVKQFLQEHPELKENKEKGESK